MCWALFARNVKPDLDPKLFWLTLADEELTGFFIFAAFYSSCFTNVSMYALNGFFLLIRCINLEMVHYIYREGSQLMISKLNYISFSVDPFFILVANSVDPDEMRHFV